MLELGARYGSVSCIINHKLKDPTKLVVVEPDKRVWNVLEYNKKINNCNFNIIRGFISNKKLGLTNTEHFKFGGYASTFVLDNNSDIPSFTLEEIKKKCNIDKFNVLVADCEGFLEVFLDENPEFYTCLRMIIFEADYPEKCNYEKIRDKLKDNNFKCLINGHQNVWVNQ